MVRGSRLEDADTAIVVDATYEHGVSRPHQPLPFRDREQVRIVIQPNGDWVDATYGILGWTGDSSDLRYLAESVDLDPQEGP